MKKWCVVLSNPTILPEGIQILSQEADVFVTQGPDEDSIIQCVNEHQAQAIFVRVEQITRRIFESCPSLQIVQEHGIGCDNIDLDAATDHGVMVLNIPGGTATPVSEHAVMMIFALARDLLRQDSNARQGKWPVLDKERRDVRQVSLEGKNLFLVGLGNIGRKVAHKMQGMGMVVGAYDQYLSAQQMEELGVRKIQTLEEGLRWADVVSIHAPLNDETRHMISTEQFRIMKDSAFLINCSRGGLIDEAALYQALRNQEIAGAGIDVFLEEPIDPERNPLLTLDRIVASPHCAGASLESRARPAIRGAQGILAVLHGEMPQENLVNRAVLERARRSVKI